MDISGFLNVPEADEFKSEPVPVGTRIAVMVMDAELADTMKGGKRLKFELKVAEEGDYKGRLMWLGLNIYNPNSEKNQAISQRDYRILCEALGFEGKENNPLKLKGKCCTVYVSAHSEQNDKGYINEEIRDFKPVTEGFAPAVSLNGKGVKPAAHHTTHYADDDIPF